MPIRRFTFDNLRGHSYLVYAIWFALLAAGIGAVIERNWSLVYLAIATFILSLLPVFFANRFGIRLPVTFFAMVVAFIFSTIFLGEAYDFYERFWWWDMVLHTGSAVGFGLIGSIFMFMLFEGDRYAAPSWAIAFMAFCFAVAVGAIWEIFEFGMDQIFGLNMQKSGLVDTMYDLIVDVIGAIIGASAGYAYLRYRRRTGLAGQLAYFIENNRRFFRKSDRRPKSK